MPKIIWCHQPTDDTPRRLCRIPVAVDLIAETRPIEFGKRHQGTFIRYRERFTPRMSNYDPIASPAWFEETVVWEDPLLLQTLIEERNGQ